MAATIEPLHNHNPSPSPDTVEARLAEPAYKSQLIVPGEPFRINNKRFMSDLRFLIIIQQLLVSNKTDIKPKDKPLLQLSGLRLLQIAWWPERVFRKDQCRAPTALEWAEVERRIITLEKYLPRNLIVRAGIKHISGSVLEKIALWLLGFSIISLSVAIQTGTDGVFHGNFVMLLTFLTLWSAAVGALGSVALLYVNALSIQIDPKVDVTSRTLVRMRLILGALFGVILTLPFECSNYRYMQNLVTEGNTLVTEGSNIEWSHAFLLLLPFLLGFSTPLVLSILGNLIQSAQAFFGLRPAGALAQNDLSPENGPPNPQAGRRRSSTASRAGS